MTIELPDHELMIIQACQKLKEDLAFHLISYHADPMAIERNVKENVEQHRHEHFGPCGIRLHDPSLDAGQNYELLTWDAARIEEILEEAEEQDYGFVRSTLPNGERGELFWRSPSCGRIRHIGGH